jgi:hypothetical protein
VPSAIAPTYTADCKWAGADCAVLTGTQYFRLPPVNLGAMSASAGFSICLWFVFDSASTWGRLFDIGLGQANSNIFLGRFGNTAALHLEFWIGLYDAQSFDSPNPIVLGEWRHACVVNQGRDWTLYDNGTPNATFRASYDLPQVSLTSGYIGKSNWLADTEMLAGKVDELRMYSRALSAGEVADVYSSQGAPRLLCSAESS